MYQATQGLSVHVTTWTTASCSVTAAGSSPKRADQYDIEISSIKRKCGVAVCTRYLTSHCSPGGELSAQADEPATVKCIQCNERLGSEVRTETAGSPILDSQKFDCGIQCTQVSHLLVGGLVQSSCDSTDWCLDQLLTL